MWKNISRFRCFSEVQVVIPQGWIWRRRLLSRNLFIRKSMQCDIIDAVSTWTSVFLLFWLKNQWNPLSFQKKVPVIVPVIVERSEIIREIRAIRVRFLEKKFPLTFPLSFFFRNFAAIKHAHTRRHCEAKPPKRCNRMTHKDFPAQRFPLSFPLTLP